MSTLQPNGTPIENGEETTEKPKDNLEEIRKKNYLITLSDEFPLFYFFIHNNTEIMLEKRLKVDKNIEIFEKIKYSKKREYRFLKKLQLYNSSLNANSKKLAIIKGINISIFAYGQTSTGKTFTMKGESKTNEGLIPLCIREIFNALNNPDSNITKSVVKVSYSEIYNETVNDLIDTNKKNLEIRESPKGIFVNNLSEIIVTNVEKAF